MTVSNWLRLALVCFIALILQVSVLDQVLILGVHPDLMVMLAAAVGLVAGPQRGAISGFLIGLFADFAVNTPYGLSSLDYVLVGFGVGMLRSIPAGRDSAGAQLAALVAAASVGTLGYEILGALVGQSGFLGPNTVPAVLVVALGSVPFGIPAIWVCDWAFAGSSQTFEVGAIPRGGSASG